MNLKILSAMLLMASACSAGAPDASVNAAPEEKAATQLHYKDISIKRLDPRLDAIIAEDAKAEIIAEGLQWSEGPVWIGDDQSGYLLFSDVPGNRMHKWSRNEGASVFLEPSGAAHDATGFREPGSNGLIRDAQDGAILVANHGLRSIARLDLTSKSYELVASAFNGEPFNSPNDLALANDGAIFFTDPPYGLEGINASPMKRQPANGVYRRDASGDITLLIDDLTFPNGIGLSPDEQTLYVAVSDPQSPVILTYDLTADDLMASKTVLHDGGADVAAGKPGLPDGLAIDATGNLFATAPGGVHIFSPAGDLIGIIDTGVANANCTIGEGGETLFIAANTQILRIPLASAHD